jgi:hypothetical protein
VASRPVALAHSKKAAPAADASRGLQDEHWRSEPPTHDPTAAEAEDGDMQSSGGPSEPRKARGRVENPGDR